MDAKTVFDNHAAQYDALRRKLVPHFDEFYGTALEQIPYPHDAAIRILDLGAGTGLLSALAAAVFPNARFTLADISTGMLAKAQERFAGQENVEYLLIDLEHEALTGEYEVAFSSLALHHLEHDQLAAVFRKAYEVIVPGGAFINADQTLGTSAANEARYAAQWLADVTAQGSSDQETADALERMKVDKTATLADQMAWLRAAGFKDVDCWYKYYRMAVYSGRK
jgi:tRNA (cmo5U34)-methyltransferase